LKECAVCSRCLDDVASTCPEDGAGLRDGLPGPTLLDGKYALEQRLGEGGMGVVFRARHVALDRRFALKVVRGPSTEGRLARFRREAMALGRLKHPGIVDVTDFGVDPRAGGLPYLVMELLDGESLESRLRDGPRLSTEDSLALLEQTAQAVDFAHARGVLHRDLKPSNVLLRRRADSSPGVKLLDFGLALLDPAGDWAAPGRRAADLSPTVDDEVSPTRASGRPESEDPPDTVTVARDSSASSVETGILGSPIAEDATAGTTRPGEILGTPFFMAPERFSGGASSRAGDIYALGVVAFALLTGRLPFVGSLGAVARAHLHEAPPRPSSLVAGIPPGVDAAVLRALAKSADDRPATAGELVAAIREGFSAERRAAWRKRELPRRAAIAAAAGLLAAASMPLALRANGVQALERAALDARFARAPTRPWDARIAVVLLDEASLAEERRALADMAEPVATRLEQVFAAGARAVAVDLILPAGWGRSGSFSRLAVGHADRLVLAAHATPEGMVGTEAVAGVAATALGEQAAGRLFGLVNLEEDPDGVVRRGRLAFPTVDGPPMRSWATAAAAALTDRPGLDPPAGPALAAHLAPAGTFFIDHSAADPPGSVMSWRDLGTRLEQDPSSLHGKLVLVGARLAGSGDDALRVPGGPARSDRLPGALVQARTIDTILTGFPLREAPAAALLLWVGGVVAAVVGAVLCSPSARWAAPALLVAAALQVGGPALAFRHGTLLPVATPLLLLLVAAALALLYRRFLSARPV